jgi:hypothetical protein
MSSCRQRLLVVFAGLLVLAAGPAAAARAPNAVPAYAAGVRAASLTAVVDLATSPPGPITSPTKVPGRDPLPACVKANSPGTHQLTVDPTKCGSVKLKGWILHGWDIRVVGTGTLEISDVDWTPRQGARGYALGVGNFEGVFSGSPSVTIEHSTIDGSGQAPNGAFAVLGAGDLILKSNRIKNFGPTLVATTGEHTDGRRRNLVLTGNWLGPIGMNAYNGVAADPTKYWNKAADHDDPARPGGAHAEFIKTNFGVTLSITGNLFDLFDNPGNRGASFTSFISVEGFEGKVSGTISGNVFRWNRGQAWTREYVPRTVSSSIFVYSRPANARWDSFTYAVTLSGNAIQKGAYGHVTRDDRAPGGSGSTLVNGGGNVDYETGAPLRF